MDYRRSHIGGHIGDGGAMSDYERALEESSIFAKKVGEAMTSSYTKGHEAGVIRLNTALITFMNVSNKFSISFDEMQKIAETVRQDISEDEILEEETNEI